MTGSAGVAVRRRPTTQRIPVHAPATFADGANKPAHTRRPTIAFRLGSIG
jgi:hypothetical protein